MHACFLQANDSLDRARPFCSSLIHWYPCFCCSGFCTNSHHRCRGSFLVKDALEISPTEFRTRGKAPCVALQFIHRSHSSHSMQIAGPCWERATSTRAHPSHGVASRRRSMVQHSSRSTVHSENRPKRPPGGYAPVRVWYGRQPG